jgi:regulator of protease activity HflC (stomatin/prohibitin superfamily)
MAVLILSWFVKSLYDLPNVSQSSRFVLRSVFGKPGFPPFFIFREGGEEVDAVEEETLRNVGGPGSILLEQDAAVLLERAGRFTRVKIPPGVVKLQRFERVYATIDLSPRVWPFTVSAMSKEGIPIKCNVNVHFQVNPTGGEDAVFTAATCTWVRGEHWLEDKLDWAGRVIISNTEGTLRSIIARTPLNQLIPAQITHPIKGTRGAITKRTVRSDIERELRESLERSAPNLGAVILDVRLGDIEVEEIVRKHWAVLWRTGWRSWATEVVNEGKTSYREKIEDARIEGQVALLEVLGRTIQELKRAGIPITNDLVALHFLDVIENMDGLPEGWMQTYLPEPLMEAIEQLKTL